jgi:hypothetical protein
MKDSEIDAHLTRYLSGDSPRETFRQQALRDSTAEFVRFRWRRSAWRKAAIATAAVLIAGIAFFFGRLSASSPMPKSVDVAPPTVARPEGVKVPSDLIAWLEAARLFRQLGMEDRMARAVERAGKLLPYGAVAESSIVERDLTATGDTEVLQNQKKFTILNRILYPHESVESISGIMAQSFGDYYYESKMD